MPSSIVVLNFDTPEGADQGLALASVTRHSYSVWSASTVIHFPALAPGNGWNTYPASLWPIGAVVRQDLDARRNRAGKVSV
jgi:hypothetical protein